jgi:hypothetical protein
VEGVHFPYTDSIHNRPRVIADHCPAIE